MVPEYFNHPRRFPKNVAGPFYTTGHCEASGVWHGDCLWCGAPEAEAPQLFAPFDDSYTDTYFIRQPSTPEETDRAICAAMVCCVCAVRYGGRDERTISKLGNDPAVCDYIIDHTRKLICTVGPNGELLPFAKRMVDKRNAELQHQWRKQNKKWWKFWTWFRPH